MLPSAQQSDGISSKPITGIKRPAPAVGCDALFAVVEFIAVVVNRYEPTPDVHLEVTSVDLIPRLRARPSDAASLENDFSQNLTDLPGRQTEGSWDGRVFGSHEDT